MGLPISHVSADGLEMTDEDWNTENISNVSASFLDGAAMEASMHEASL